MKYTICLLTEILVWPDNAKLLTGQNGTARELGEKLAEGFEIYQAIPFHTNEVAGIRYILRKENEIK